MMELDLNKLFNGTKEERLAMSKLLDEKIAQSEKEIEKARARHKACVEYEKAWHEKKSF